MARSSSSESEDAGTDTNWSGQLFMMQTDLTKFYIPDDLVMNILPRLPVKSLLRFRAVSKHWFALISDPTFADSHLRHASENNTESFIFNTKIDLTNLIALHHNDFSTVDHPYVELKLSGNLYIVGSCNGIVCVVFTSNRTRQLYLWNPATKKANLLSPHWLVIASSLLYFGFGFDPIASDFKVIRICHSVYDDQDIHAMVYSANANAWKVIEPPETLPDYSPFCDACVNGVLHWIRNHSVLRYDLNNEVFYHHKFPANVLIRTQHPEYYNVKIMEMKDSIAVITYQRDMVALSSKVDLWTVDEGFERSWTLRYNFDVASLVDRFHGYLNNSGDILFKTHDGVFWLYNLEKKVEKTIKVPEGTSEVFKHIESLVPIRGTEDLGENLMKDRPVVDQCCHESITFSFSF